MTDPESILQLGIEAAKEGNNTEARDLFRLLTREDPNNARGWLWLAGVAENQDERQHALTQVLELEPDNELARQGLEAMGVEPLPRAAAPVAASPAPPPDDPFGEDDPFAELDSLSDTFNEAPASVRRADVEDSPSGGRKGSDGLPEVYRAGTESSAGSAGRSVRGYEEDTMTSDSSPNQGGPLARLRPVLLVLVPLLAVILLCFWLNVPGIVMSWFTGGEEQAQQVEPPPDTETPPAEGDPNAAPPAEGDPNAAPPAEGDPNAAPPAEGDPNAAPPAEGDPNAAPPAEGGEPTAPDVLPQPTGPVPDPAAANPAIVPANTPLESNGWLYDFNRPGFATYFVGNLGGTVSQDRFAVILLFVVNRAGQPQAIPADFFVLKDAQGRVHTPLPDASAAYVNQFGGRGVVADLTMQDTVPADGLTRSVPLVFNVPADATDMVLFARSNPDQGWLVLPNVR